MREGAILWTWFAQTGWLPVLAVLTLALLIYQVVWTYKIRQALSRVEAKYQGVQERLRYAITKADKSEAHIRRITEEAVLAQVDQAADTIIRGDGEDD